MMKLNMKRLLIIADRFYPQVGGAEFNIFMQSLELGKHYKVDVFTPIRDKNKKKEKRKNVRIFRFLNLYNLFNKFPYLTGKTLCPSMFFKILLGRYDIIHCFPAHCYNNMLAVIAAKIKRIKPIFLTNFDLWGYGELIINKKISLSEAYKIPLTKKQKWFLKQFKAIFTISKNESKIIKSVNKNTFLSTVPIKIEEYNKDLDLTSFKKKFKIEQNKKIILCLSRIAYIKGQDILLKSLPLLKKKFKNFIVLIVGRGDYEPEYENSLKNFVHKNKLEKHVIFTGPLSRNDVLAAYKVCDIHVLPMRFMNSGAVVIETWAAGKPVLQSTRIDPCYVVEGENGLTFNINNSKELADKISYLLKRPALRKKMGINGRNLVEKKFLYPHLIKQYMDEYC